MTPLAVAAGVSLDGSPMVIAVLFAASNSFMTPIGDQTDPSMFSVFFPF